MTDHGKGGRPRKGSLYWTKSGWRARLTIDVDGVAVQKSFNLETHDKQAARVKLYEETQRILFDEVPMVPLMTMPEMRAVSKKVSGYLIYPAGGEYLFGASLKE